MVALKPSDRWDSLIQYYAERVGLPWDICKRQMLAESAGNPDAVSPCGAMGLYQLMPATARELKVADPFRPDHNIRGGTEYDAQQLSRIRVKWPTIADADAYRMMFAAFNMGPGYVITASKGLVLPTWPVVAEALKTVTFNGKRPDWKQTLAYVEKILPPDYRQLETPPT